MFRRAKIGLRRLTIAALVASAIGGCSLFQHQPTPQERFADALSRGNSMEAAAIWRSMTPDEKENFALGNGMKPDPEMEAAAKKEAGQEQPQSQSAAPEPSSDNNLSIDEDDGRSGKTLADFFHGSDGKGGITDDNGQSGHTLSDFIPYMKGRTGDDQEEPSDNSAKSTPAAQAEPLDTQPAQPSDEIQVR